MIGNGNDSASRTVDHWNRGAPVSLSRDTPVLDLESDGAFAKTFTHRKFRHLELCFFARKSGIRSAVCQLPIFFPTGLAFTVHNYVAFRNSILARKFLIAGIVSRNRHDRAGSVFHQDIVGYPDRDRLSGKRVNGICPGKEAMFFEVFFAVQQLFLPQFARLIAQVRMPVAPDDIQQRMLRS